MAQASGHRSNVTRRDSHSQGHYLLSSKLATVFSSGRKMEKSRSYFPQTMTTTPSFPQRMENTCSQEFLGAYAAGTQKLGPQITADSGLGQPEQDHQTFGVSDTGRITVVTQTSVLKSAENGSMFESCKFEMPLSPVTSYRSVSGDGKTLALIRKNKGAFYYDDLGNNRSPGKAKQLVLPNNAAPQSIVISNDGSTVAVRFDPRRRLDDQKEIQSGYRRNLRKCLQRV